MDSSKSEEILSYKNSTNTSERAASIPLCRQGSWLPGGAKSCGFALVALSFWNATGQDFTVDY